VPQIVKEPQKILILFAHPVLERSRVNRRLVDAVRDLEGVTIHDLYELYPTLAIDVRREQKLLTEHDVVIFQHPFYWYSTPAIMKEWQDLVLEHGWAYGASDRSALGREGSGIASGDALAGKITFNVVSTGGPASAYRREGYNRFTVRELLAPYEQTAGLCKMRYLPPFTVHAALRLEGDDVLPHAIEYRRLLEAVSRAELDLERAATFDTLNACLGVEDGS
jgi:glutathione-regulated potassium-efflux system ancillary protein KefG